MLLPLRHCRASSLTVQFALCRTVQVEDIQQIITASVLNSLEGTRLSLVTLGSYIIPSDLTQNNCVAPATLNTNIATLPQYNRSPCHHPDDRIQRDVLQTYRKMCKLG